jgi:hypothetical protein
MMERRALVEILGHVIEVARGYSIYIESRIRETWVPC